MMILLRRGRLEFRLTVQYISWPSPPPPAAPRRAQGPLVWALNS